MKAMLPGKLRQVVLAEIDAAHPAALVPTEIVSRVGGTSAHSVRHLLRRLLEKGVVQRDRYGAYSRKAGTARASADPAEAPPLAAPARGGRCPLCGCKPDENARARLDLIARATALLSSGHNGVTAAHELGLTSAQLSVLMSKAGTPVKSFRHYPGFVPGSSNPERTREMVKLRRAGWTYSRLAEHFAISGPRIRQIIMAHTP